MTGKEIVKELMKQNDITNAAMADMLNITPAAMWERLNGKKNKDLSVTTMSDMLRVLGYKICVIPRDTRVPDNGFKVG